MIQLIDVFKHVENQEHNFSVLIIAENFLVLWMDLCSVISFKICKYQVDIAYAPFIERFQLFLAEAKNYDITKGRPKLKLWIEVIQNKNV